MPSGDGYNRSAPTLASHTGACSPASVTLFHTGLARMTGATGTHSDDGEAGGYPELVRAWSI